MSFQPSWFANWNWISYNEIKEAAFCHPCSMVRQLGLNMLNKPVETASTEYGFSNWKDASR